MSRCFPFDPSKYERKTTTDDPDLLKKEKHREKKHKKEKKDKEKKEGKREKERSDDKRKEKKDKKDKHKDKKKDKEKHRDKDKHKTDTSQIPDEKGSVALPGPQIPLPVEKSKDNSRTNDRSAAAPMVEKRVAPASQNGEVVAKNSHLGSETRASKYPPEMGWRSLDEEKRPNFQMPDKNLTMERKKDGLVKFSGKSPGPKDERAGPGDPRFSGNARVPPNSVGPAQNRVGAPARPMVVERKIDLRMEGKEKEKNREREGDDGKREKSREKEKRKEEKVKATGEQLKHIELSRMMEHGSSKNQLPKPVVKDGIGIKKEFPSANHNSGLQNVPRNSSNHNSSGPVTVSSSLGKRKDFGLNGSYDEHTSGPNKLARTTTTTSTPMENGRSMMMEPPSPATQQRPAVKVDPTLAPTNHTHQKPPMVGVNVVKAEPTKDRKINGTITAAKADRKPDALPPPIARGPHPDAKYLSQVLSVPKMDEFPAFDDEQEWLFSSSSSSSSSRSQPRQQRQNPEEEEAESCSTSTPQVWAKALWLEPVDIHALPYVIPH